MTDWSSGYVADVTYTHGFYGELTPALLNFVALLRNVRGPELATPLAYCELGCGQGFSTNLLAASNPDIQFYANDFNPAHVAGARALAAEAGTPNVHFYEDGFAEFADRRELPEFDFIALHGIYSWVAAEHRRSIVEFVRRKLRPGGLLYVSYNAMPGLATMVPLRTLMHQYGGARGGATVSRVDPALELLSSLNDAKAKFFLANSTAHAQAEALKTKSRNYLVHEYFNETWTPFYQADVVKELEPAKVQYLGSSNLLDHVDMINLTEAQRKVLADAPPSLRETVRDFIVNQQFRRDVFVKGAVIHNQPSNEAAWNSLVLTLTAKIDPANAKVTGALGEATLNPETYRPILDRLAKGSISVAALRADPPVAAMGWPMLAQALTILTGAGHLQVSQSHGATDEAKAAARRFNEAVIDRAVGSDELGALAAPNFGGGLPLVRVGQLFLKAHWSGEDPIPFVWKILNSQGQRLIKDGKTLETEEENLAELADRFEAFRTTTLWRLEQAGIV